MPEAGSQRALSHPCLPFSSLQLGSVFPWLWCALFGEDRIKTKARGSAPTWLLLALGSCLCSLWPYPGIQDAACPGKGGRRIVPWALLFGRGVKALPYHCFPGFPVFPKVPVLPGGSPISRLVQRKQREPKASQGGGTRAGWSFFLLFEQNWALDGLSLSQLTMPQAAQIFPKPWSSIRSLETAGGKIRYLRVGKKLHILSLWNFLFPLILTLQQHVFFSFSFLASPSTTWMLCLKRISVPMQSWKRKCKW